MSISIIIFIHLILRKTSIISTHLMASIEDSLASRKFGTIVTLLILISTLFSGIVILVRKCKKYQNNYKNLHFEVATFVT